MKIQKLSWIALVALGSLVVLGPTARAQDKNTEKSTAKLKAEGKGKRPRGAKAGARPDRMKQWATELNLTAEQKEKLKPIRQEEAQKLKALREDTSLSREAKRTKLAEIRDATNAKVKSILTADQIAKWEKIKKETRKEAPTKRKKK